MLSEGEEMFVSAPASLLNVKPSCQLLKYTSAVLGGQIHPRVNGREEKTDWDVLSARSTRTAHRAQLVKVSRVAEVRGNGQARNERCVAVSRATAIYKPTE